MTLRIYGIARTRAFRALWIAEELGLSYEHLPIEIGDAGAGSPEFRKINPNGRLPFIDDGGFVLVCFVIGPSVTVQFAGELTSRGVITNLK